jgi:hypothetical protein
LDELWKVVDRYKLAGAPTLELLILYNSYTNKRAALMRGGTRSERDTMKEFLNDLLRAGGKVPLNFIDADDVESEAILKEPP